MGSLALLVESVRKVQHCNEWIIEVEPEGEAALILVRLPRQDHFCASFAPTSNGD